MRRILIILLFINATCLCAQPISTSDSLIVKPNQKRLIAIGVGATALYSGTLIGLNELWYKQNEKSSFHFFNDNDEWLQLDKFGHAYTAYNQSVFGIKAMKWAGLPHKKAVLYGSLAGIVFQTPIEILDGYSSAWGFSWGDMIANTVGAASAFTQFYFWDEAKIKWKYSFLRSGLASERPNVLGRGLNEQIIKDYNSHTYWLSFDANSFISSKIPKWLNVAVGYGGHGLVHARREVNEANGYDAYRQYYVALDLDLSSIETKRKGLKFLFWLLDCYHLPLPAV